MPDSIGRPPSGSAENRSESEERGWPVNPPRMVRDFLNRLLAAMRFELDRALFPGDGGKTLLDIRESERLLDRLERRRDEIVRAAVSKWPSLADESPDALAAILGLEALREATEAYPSGFADDLDRLVRRVRREGPPPRPEASLPLVYERLEGRGVTLEAVGNVRSDGVENGMPVASAKAGAEMVGEGETPASFRVDFQTLQALARCLEAVDAVCETHARGFDAGAVVPLLAAHARLRQARRDLGLPAPGFSLAADALSDIAAHLVIRGNDREAGLDRTRLLATLSQAISALCEGTCPVPFSDDELTEMGRWELSP